jgi:hypothetical protein
MLRRELAIALGARVTWATLALAALVIGHGFVLALDIFRATSASGVAGLDPLAGIVRPTLGGTQLVAAVLVPIVAARVLAVEKERNTFGALAVARGGGDRLLWPKLVGSIAAASLVFVAPIALFLVYPGELDVAETAVAVLGHVLHVVLVAVISLAAAAWTRTVAQATTLALVASIASWSIEAGEGFSALAWLSPLESVSVGRQLLPFELGILHEGALLWFLVATMSAVALAWLGLRFDLRSRGVLAAVVMLASAAALAATTRVHRAHDWTEGARASLPPAVVRELRALEAPIEIVVWLDREDGRRRQLERDTLTKVRLARPDVRISTPLDGREAAPFAHDEDYGRIVIRVGDAARETRSTSRREIVTLLFEAAGKPLPDWSQVPYPGHPFTGSNRTANLIAYFVIPFLFLMASWFIRSRSRKFA